MNIESNLQGLGRVSIQTRYRQGMTKRLASIALMAVFSCAFGQGISHAASANAPKAAQGANPFGLPSDVVASGKIIVASSIGHPPFEYFMEDNVTPTGFDIEIMRAIAGRLGIDVKFEDVRFPNIPPGLKSSRFDVAISALRDTEERRKYADFVDYVKNSYQLLASVANPLEIKSPEDLCGHRVGGVSGQTHLKYVTEFSQQCAAGGKKAIEIMEFPNTAAVLLALKNGRIDAYYDTTATAKYTVKTDPSFKTVGKATREVVYGIAFPLGKKELVDAVQKALQSLIDDGTYSKLIHKYGFEDLAVDRATVNKGIG